MNSLFGVDNCRGASEALGFRTPETDGAGVSAGCTGLVEEQIFCHWEAAKAEHADIFLGGGRRYSK